MDEGSARGLGQENLGAATLSCRSPSFPRALRLLLYITDSTRRVLRTLAGGLLFLAGWTLLNVMFNMRYPARVIEPRWWYLLPSIDATALLGILAVLGWMGRELPRRVLGGLAGFVIFVRLFRVSDGLIEQTYFRPLQLSLDVPLLPELVRLLYSTMSLPRLLLGTLLLGVVLALALLVIGGSLLHAQRFFAGGHLQRGLFAAVVAGLVALAPMWPATSYSGLHKGLFGVSFMPTLVEQARLAASASRTRFIKATQIAATQRRLQQMPSGLEHLRGADVLFFLVESYGSTVFRNPDYLVRMRTTFDSFDKTLGPLGYATASASLDSSTYGGGSWLAHATLASGVRITNGTEFALLRQIQPPPVTMAGFFQRTGYRTVVVQPGTTRRFPEGEVRGFAGKYYLPDLDYHGPAFGWATMPDQYVLDFIHRREVLPARSPLFIQYALVSSHAPWAIQPELVDDWSELSQGRVFDKMSPRRYPVEWSSMFRGGEAYVDSLLYDLELIKRYVGQQVNRPSLIIVMGDHQPPVLAVPAESHSVPVHVLSKDRALIGRFVDAGFEPGMYPSSLPPPGMETFLRTLIEQLSGPPAPVAP